MFVATDLKPNLVAPSRDLKALANLFFWQAPGLKSNATQRLVRELQARNIQIDGVGLESHFASGDTPSQKAQESNMRALTDLGVEVAVTELDVKRPVPATDKDIHQQSRDFYSTVAACMAVEKCIGITVWDFADDASWLQSKHSGYATLFDQPKGDDTKLIKKAAYNGCLRALEGKSAPEP